MSVLIKGMEIPKDCRECPFEGYHVDIGQTYCMACLKVLATAFKPISFDGRSKWCPLVELPEEHGDLIDRTALMKEFELAQKSADMHGREYANAFYSSGGEISTEWWAVEDLVENAIAVIEAEDGK